MIFRSACVSPRHYIVFLTLATQIFATGCAHNPYLQEWDFGVKPDDEKTRIFFEQQQKSVNSNLERIYAQHKNWRNNRANDEFFVESYDTKGRKIGFQTVK